MKTRRIVLICVMVACALAAFTTAGFATGTKEATGATRISFWGAAEFEETWKYWIAGYEKAHPGITVDYTPFPYADFFTKLPIAMQSGSGPDTFYYATVYQDVLLPHMAPYPSDTFNLAQLRKDFKIVDAHLQDGKLYYMQCGMKFGGIYYNTDMWQAAGLTQNDIPKTWDQLVSVAKKLTKTDANGKITVAGLNVNGSNAMIDDLVLQQGSFIFSKDDKVVLNTKEWASALKQISDLYFVHNVARPDMPNAWEALGNQQAAMVYGWGWFVSYLAGNFPNVHYSWFPIPTVDGKTPPMYAHNNGEVTPGVNKASPADRQKTAFDFVKFIISDDDMLAKFNTMTGEIPNKKSLDDRMKTDPIISLHIPLVDRTAFIFEPLAFLNDEAALLQDVLLNKTPIDTALKGAQTKMDLDLKGVTFVSGQAGYKYASQLRYPAAP
jgi:multiple sugar transport system substrate-binding protein